MKVVIVGAGLSGLVAAHELGEAGVEVTVVDKGRSVGGRLATRRIGEARLDHGAQFFTVRSPAFQRRVNDWLERDVVRVWNHGFDPEASDVAGDGHPRYVGSDGMNAMAKDLAATLPSSVTIETSTMAFGVKPSNSDHRWTLVIDDGTSRPADSIILTSPLPQTYALLVDGGVEMDEQLMRTEYDRTIGLLCTLDQPVRIGAAGGIQDPDEVFSFIGDNASKGISQVPAVTFHANAQWSETHWHDDDLDGLLREAAADWLGDATIVESQVKKWRLATPRSIWPDPCWVGADGTIVLAGDAFAGPKVEGAHNSGLAAAHALLA